ncbi:MAG: DUF4261 domain-containing protein [Oscillospiraceae bacterium]|nr:DUF4261 domain-containing protein [Oscillospiraceae bacterium]
MNNNETGRFLGFVLLKHRSWDMDSFFKRLRDNWNIEPKDLTNAKGDENIFVFEHDSMHISLTFIPAPVPEHEAEDNAAFNYMWRDAVDQVSQHTAQIVVSVMGGEDKLESALTFVKVCDSAIDDDTIGIYTNGIVYQPRMYSEMAQSIKERQLPILDLVWIGLTNAGNGKFNGYTMGLENFGKYEIEVIGCTTNPSKLLDFLTGITGYVIGEDATLKDGETIGFTADQKLKISLSDGVEFDYKTLKIEYPY